MIVEERDRDMEVDRGDIKWTMEGYYDLVSWFAKLKQTPKDDWNLGKDSIKIGEKEYSVNRFSLMSQVLRYMSNKYGDKTALYSLRFQNITDFIKKYSKNLERDKLLENNKGTRISKALIKVLCEMGYNKKETTNGEEHYTFDYDEVIERVEEDRD